MISGRSSDARTSSGTPEGTVPVAVALPGRSAFFRDTRCACSTMGARPYRIR